MYNYHQELNTQFRIEPIATSPSSVEGYIASIHVTDINGCILANTNGRGPTIGDALLSLAFAMGARP